MRHFAAGTNGIFPDEMGTANTIIIVFKSCVTSEQKDKTPFRGLVVTNSTGMSIALYLNEIFPMLHVAVPSLLRIAGEVLSQSGTY